MERELFGAYNPEYGGDRPTSSDKNPKRSFRVEDEAVHKAWTKGCEHTSSSSV